MAVCRICHNAEGNREFIAREQLYGTGEEFAYFECAGCGCIQIVDIPADLARFYPADYYTFAQRPQRDRGLKHWLLRARTRYVLGRFDPAGRALARRFGVPDYLRWLARLGLSLDSRLLDVGCGGGELALTLRNWGFTHVSGIDPHLAADRHIADVLLHRGSLDDVAERCDLLIYNHSFEHIPDPRRELAAALRVLAPGGWLILRMPVAGCHAWCEYGADWIALDAPRHLLLYTVRGLTSLAGQCGLALAGVEFDSTARQFWGSEQNRRGIALHSAESYRQRPDSGLFTALQIAQWQAQARQLNASGEGDCAAFFLQRG
jgi:SAM-dependent methyltransferase